jgi:hypothetical protein
METVNVWMATTNSRALVLLAVVNKLLIQKLEYVRLIVGQMLLISHLPNNVYAMQDITKFGIHVENAKMDWSIIQVFYAALGQKLFVIQIKFMIPPIKFAIVFQIFTESTEYAKHVQAINFSIQVLEFADLHVKKTKYTLKIHHHVFALKDFTE